MKRILFSWFTITVFAIFAFNACSDDDNPTEPDNNGGGTVTSVSGTIDNWTLGDGYTVKLVVDTDAKNIFEAGTSSISTSGNFNIENIKAVPADFLTTASDDLPDSVNTTNPNAKVASGSFYVYNNSGTQTGEIYSEGTGSTSWYEAIYVYSDSDVSYSGSYNNNGYVTNVDITFKKGWNVYYFVTDFADNNYSSKLTSTKPGDLSWTYGYKTKKAPRLF